MEEIFRRELSHLEQREVQEFAIRSVKKDPEFFLQKYIRHPQSFNGRYNAVVHNSAAVLASEQFKRVVSEKDKKGTVAMFLTGIPGAGKTSTFLVNHYLHKKYQILYEGQLSNATLAVPKINLALNNNLNIMIYAVHTKPETALDNTIKRFNSYGRGAGINIMAHIQGELPDSLDKLYNHFGNKISLTVFDNRDIDNKQMLEGFKHLNILKSEGSSREIKECLVNRIEEYKKNGKISEACYRQAAPPGRGQDMTRCRNLIKRFTGGI